MAQDLQQFAETRETGSEKETCKGTSSSGDTEPLPATVETAGATGSHTVVTPYEQSFTPQTLPCRGAWLYP